MEINVKKYFYSDNLEILVKSENTTIKEEYKISDFQDFVVDLLKKSIITYETDYNSFANKIKEEIPVLFEKIKES